MLTFTRFLLILNGIAQGPSRHHVFLRPPYADEFPPSPDREKVVLRVPMTDRGLDVRSGSNDSLQMQGMWLCHGSWAAGVGVQVYRDVSAWGPRAGNLEDAERD
jgi:hypothetical protein